MKANMGTIKALLSKHADDRELVELIVDSLESFENYHKSIYSLEIQRELFACGVMDSETYREKIPFLDQIRTSAHNSVISNVKILNRLAEQSGLKPFYDDTVSEKKPYRTELADAIMEFVSVLIDERVK